MFKSLLLLDTKVRLWLLFVSFFFCFFFGWEGDTFLHSGQKSENGQAIKAAKSGREGIYFYFSKN
jgi:hypothetical protein